MLSAPRLDDQPGHDIPLPLATNSLPRNNPPKQANPALACQRLGRKKRKQDRMNANQRPSFSCFCHPHPSL